MSPVRTNRNRAFSLIELVIVIVIIGIIGAIAIPRMSRGAAGAADSALTANLAVLRNSIELYQTEHEGLYPTVLAFAAELTSYSDIFGGTSATKTTVFIYGPYLREVPAIPVGAERGNNGVAAAAGPGIAWIYNETTGQISANAAGTDDKGKAYSAY